MATAALLEMRARFEFEEGRREAALALLRKARERRAPALAQASANLYEHLFEQGLNLARALEWGDGEAGLRKQLGEVVGRWPGYGLSPRLEAVRAAAKKMTVK